MARGYIQPGNVITAIAPAGGVVGGKPVLLSAAAGGKVVVPLHTVAEGKEYEAATIGVYRVEKTAALAIGQGELVYLDTATKLINKTAASNSLAGWCVTAAAADASHVEVMFGQK